MNRKATALMAAGLLALTLAGCGQAPASGTVDDAAASETSDPTATVAPSLMGDQYGNVGEGTAYLQTDEGTTKDGGVPTLAVNPQKLHALVAVVTEGIPADPVTHVYVDGKEVLGAPMDDGTHELELTGDQLSDGTHSIEIVQFANNDPSATPTFYRSGRYTVA